MENLDNIKINGLLFNMTCSICPEQYDVFDEDGNQVAYVRERHEHLTVECPDCGGLLVFETYLEGTKNVADYRYIISKAINEWRNKDDKNKNICQ